MNLDIFEIDLVVCRQPSVEGNIIREFCVDTPITQQLLYEEYIDRIFYAEEEI